MIFFTFASFAISNKFSVLTRFDEVFEVIADHDAERLQIAAESLRAAGKELPPSLLQTEAAGQISDAHIEELLTERASAKRARDFSRADGIRQKLAEAGVILEDTKDGVRWKRR